MFDFLKELLLLERNRDEYMWSELMDVIKKMVMTICGYASEDDEVLD
jgi:hypothetical protein